MSATTQQTERFVELISVVNSLFARCDSADRDFLLGGLAYIIDRRLENQITGLPDSLRDEWQALVDTPRPLET